MTPTTATLAGPTQTLSLNNTSQFPTGFNLSGNIGYEFGKPVMRAILNNQNINIPNDPTQWWPLMSGDNCDVSTTTEPVLFGINTLAGCSLVANTPCNILQDKSNRYLELESSLTMYRVASFANMNITNLDNWLPILPTSNVAPGIGCSLVTTRVYQILYARTGSTQYLHNKIIGVRAQSLFDNVVANSGATVFLKTVVNFVDVTPQSVVATKLSPFLNIRLPRDFFYPIGQ